MQKISCLVKPHITMSDRNIETEDNYLKWYQKYNGRGGKDVNNIRSKEYL